MQLRRPVLALLCVGLAAFILLEGVVPACRGVQSDFPNYLTAARIVAEGGAVERLYDTPWFQEQMRRYGTGGAAPTPGKFAPFPPPTALLLLPLARLAPLEALRLVTGLSLLALAAAIGVLARVLDWTRLETAVFVLLAGAGLASDLRLGQPYVWVSLSCIAGYRAWQRQRPMRAGAAFALFAPLKYYPALFLLYFAARGERRLIGAAALTIGAIVLVSLALLGLPVHREFLASVLGPHLLGRPPLQSPFSASFQSIDALFLRLFAADPAHNPRPLIDAPGLAAVGPPLVKVALALATLAALRRLARTRGTGAIAPSVGLLGVAALLLAPATATYHFLLLWLPLGLLVEDCRAHGARGSAYALLALYAAIGFCPYGHALRFEGRGALGMLAFPRLWLMSALFALALHRVWTEVPAAGYTPPRSSLLPPPPPPPRPRPAP